MAGKADLLNTYRMYDLFRQGLTVKQIAAQEGISDRSVYLRFKRQSLSLNPPGRPQAFVEPWTKLCVAPRCDALVRSRNADLCETHYYRLRRTGTTDDPIHISGICVADDCPDLATHGAYLGLLPGQGYCRKHYLRVKRRGDASFEFGGENHHMWLGDKVTNPGLHQRIRRARGKATSHHCVDCGEPAAQWSYDRSDPDQLHDPEKGPYSLDIYRYHPRCVRCHKKFDLAMIRNE